MIDTEGMGFIHDKLEIKLLILYVLSLLPARVGYDELPDLVLVDGGFDYFQFGQCLSELVDTGHVLKEGSEYSVTEKGREHLEALESRLPPSVKTRAAGHARPTVERMRRDALVLTSHRDIAGGGCRVKLSLSDDVGKIMELSLLADSQDRAEQMEKNFRGRAESVYLRIVELLTEDSGGRAAE